MPSISQSFIDRMKTADATRAVADRLLERDRRNGRFFCPLHNDPTNSDDGDAALYDNGRWWCHKGSHGGDVFELVALADGLDIARDFPDIVQRVADLTGAAIEYDEPVTSSSERGTRSGRPAPAREKTPPRFGGDVRTPEPDPTPRPDLLLKLEDCIGDLPGSPAEEYLAGRGFTLEVATKYGVGWASPARCESLGFSPPHPTHGRMVFSHYCPTPDRNTAGQIITRICSLYGRAVELCDRSAEKSIRHRHLAGPKGFFNLGAVDAIGFEEPLVITEGAFDALAFIASGHRRVVATYGVHLTRLRWLRPARNICVAFDADVTGEEKAVDLAQSLLQYGKAVTVCTAEDYGGANDPAEAWRAGTLLPLSELEVTA